MGIRYYKYEVTESEIVTVPRECSNCNNVWKEKLVVTEKGRAESLQPGDQDAIRKAKEKARQNLQYPARKKEKDIDEKVLCPKCNHFAKKALAKHFPKGFRAGLKSKIKMQTVHLLFFSLGSFIGALLLLAIFVGICYGFITKEISIEKNDDSWIGIVFMIFAAIFGGLFMKISIKQMSKYILAMKNLKKIISRIENDSEDRLREIVINCYKKNKESLKRSDVWIDVLISKVS